LGEKEEERRGINRSVKGKSYFRRTNSDEALLKIINRTKVRHFEISYIDV
jgi:hypothetical protein